ncbi:MAG TPA: radical SAM protein [Aggregatilineaceae bacterium]|nr:radical SAM protein [Aggregatilineaceae bacterium]
MVNIIVSTVCNMKCTYCFAEDHMLSAHDDRQPTFISLESFERRLDDLDRSGINEIRLIGGEPTLHPQFDALIEQARRRNKHIVVFTHGLIPDRIVTVLEAIPPDDCTILVNTNATRQSTSPTDAEQSRRRAVLQRLGSRALLGFTIYTPRAELDFLLPLVLDMGCQKKIRLGLAQPISGGSNRYLHPKQYPQVGHPIARFAHAAAQHGITLELDCGFVRCMFSQDDLETLHTAGVDPAWRCNPILDIGVNGEAFHCFPLANQAVVPSAEAESAVNLRASLAGQVQPYRVAGIYKECSSCRFKLMGACTGGCLAATIKRFHDAPTLRLKVPEEVPDA